MNASQFMDKQIMDLSRSKSGSDFIDLMNSKEESQADGGIKKEEILASYDFQPIRPIGVSSYSMDDHVAAVSNSNNASFNAARPWNSSESKSYGYLDLAEGDKVIAEKAQNINHLAIVTEIDRTMKKHADNLLHSINGLSARLSQLESRMRQIENSVDELKESSGNNHGNTDGKMRQLENILREVQAGVQNVQDKQEVMAAQVHLAKLQISKVDQTSENQGQIHVNPVLQAASAPHQPSQQFPVPVQPPLSNLPLNVPLPNQQSTQPPTPLPNQYPQSQPPLPPLPQQDAYFSPSGQSQEVLHPQLQMPTALPQQPPPQQQHQQFQPAQSLPYPQPPQVRQQHLPVAPVNHPQLQPPPLGNLPEEAPYLPSQNYQSSIHQPPSQPAAVPQKQYYSAPAHIYEPSSGRSSSGFPSGYAQPPGPSEPYTYSGSPSRYGSGSTKPPQAHQSGGGSNYSQLPTARVLPQAIPTASAVSSGSGTGGAGNRVPIDDVVDKVTNMGFPREHVRATVRKLTENGQSVDLNVVLDKLMNDGDVQPPRGWFGR